MPYRYIFDGAIDEQPRMPTNWKALLSAFGTTSQRSKYARDLPRLATRDEMNERLVPQPEPPHQSWGATLAITIIIVAAAVLAVLVLLIILGITYMHVHPAPNTPPPPVATAPAVPAPTAPVVVPPPAADEMIRVRITPTWLRVDARFGSVCRRRGESGAGAALMLFSVNSARTATAAV